jgi:hypothetical protein
MRSLRRPNILACTEREVSVSESEFRMSAAALEHPMPAEFTSVAFEKNADPPGALTSVACGGSLRRLDVHV